MPNERKDTTPEVASEDATHIRRPEVESGQIWRDAYMGRYVRIVEVFTGHAYPRGGALVERVKRSGENWVVDQLPNHSARTRIELNAGGALKPSYYRLVAATEGGE